MRKDYKNILVHNMVNLGDVVFSTACLPILKAAYPSAKITIVVRPKIADIFQNHPCVDEVIEYAYKSKGDRFSVFKFANLLRSKNFDLSISLDRKPRMAMITFFAGIPERISPNKIFGEAHSWCTKLNTKTVELPYNLYSKEQYQIYQDIVAKLTSRNDLNGKFKPYLASAPPKNQQTAQELLKELGNGPYIALCVRAEFTLKNWLPERWAEVIQQLNKHYDARVFITGIEKDREYAQKIIDMSGVLVGNFCGRTEMLDLVALYEQSKMMVTTDLGAAHVAAARNVPMVTVFCISVPGRTKPITDIGELAWIELDCRPCILHKCEHQTCINGISVDMVMDKVAKVWSQIAK